ncbi:heavy metal translocating P-type ATPase [Chelatococcus reniformis]|uniref:P-type Zn(2+) transporter n=1 Tax=Chelatococcus reniformis TaxID=1494448 RepID=A0A916TWX4_9HYPH|nr:heavy metal translocating P-type ATPase [Chelatococcus reniformis]GGC48850.1 ATPase [Chelatococcus reniformis]
MAEAVRTRYRVTGMDCGACAAKVDAAVRRLPGIEEVSVSATAGTMTVHHRPTPELLARLEAQLAPLGYGIAAARPAAGHDGASAPGHRHDDDGHDHAHAHDHGCSGHAHAAPHPDDAAAEADLHGHLHVDAGAEGPWWRSRKGRLTIACGAALVLAYVAGRLAPPIAPYAFLAAMLAGLVPIARRALAGARLGSPLSIETLMTIAAVGAVAIGAAEEAAAVVFLFLVGELLEGVAAGRARASIKQLAALVPKTALVDRGDRTEEVPADRLTLGTVIVVRPGDRIAGDGEIVDGESAIDEAPVTGESTPKLKGAGEAVFAGTINGDGVLRVRIAAAAADNTIARVIQLVEEAQESKAPTERFIDRFARRYTPAVLALGVLVAVLPPLLAGASWSEWVYKGLAILLIGCPCALVISTPAAIAAALSAGARRGLLIKGGAALETVGKVTAVAFDKTGTLTAGKPEVTDVIGFARAETEVMALAGALERDSGHPLARAIVARAEAMGAPVRAAADAKAVPGKGVSGVLDRTPLFLGSPQAAAERAALTAAQSERIAALNDEGKTVSVLVAGRDVAGLIALRDEPREDAAAGLAALEAAGVSAVMLTGDNRRTATAIARGLGIEAHAELLPQNKQAIVRTLQADGRVVAVVGDGINDAPALAAADVGIAMGGGTDVALETGDAAVLHNRVMDVARMVRLSRATMANIRQNIVIALGLKALFLVTTILGLTGLWPAILADTGATVLVTLNALRLLRVRLN